MRVTPQSSDAVLRIAGSFNAAAAARLGDEIAALRRDARLVLDFTGTYDVTTLALVVLSNALASRPQDRITHRGLPRHERLFLAYLGYGDASEPPAAEAPRRRSAKRSGRSRS